MPETIGTYTLYIMLYYLLYHIFLVFIGHNTVKNIERPHFGLK